MIKIKIYASKPQNFSFWFNFRQMNSDLGRCFGRARLSCTAFTNESPSAPPAASIPHAAPTRRATVSNKTPFIGISYLKSREEICFEDRNSCRQPILCSKVLWLRKGTAAYRVSAVSAPTPSPNPTRAGRWRTQSRIWDNDDRMIGIQHETNYHELCLRVAKTIIYQLEIREQQRHHLCTKGLQFTYPFLSCPNLFIMMFFRSKWAMIYVTIRSPPNEYLICMLYQHSLYYRYELGVVWVRLTMFQIWTSKYLIYKKLNLGRSVS